MLQGEEIFQALLKKGTTTKVPIKIVQNAPTQSEPNIDTEFLVKRKAATVRSLNFAQLLGGGVLHTKLWLIDRQHFYVGSANMDWRSLTQVSFIIPKYFFYFVSCPFFSIVSSKLFHFYQNYGVKYVNAFYMEHPEVL